jgi:outer membrane protein TolC
MRSTSHILYVCAVAAMAQDSQTSLTLTQALEQVERLNPDVALARLRVLETEARAIHTKSGYQPQANLVVQGAYQNGNLQGIGLLFPGFPSRLDPYRTFNARVQVTQAIVDLSLLTQIRAARAKQGVRDHEAAAVREDTGIAVAQIYLQILQADSRITSSSARMATAESLLKQASDKESAGTGSKLDVARAIEQLENEKGLRIAAERDSQVLRVLLLKAIGLEQSVPRNFRLSAPTFVFAARGESAREALANRPDLRALEAETAIANLEIQAARQQRLPRLTGFADWGVLGSGPDRSIGTYTLGASLTVPIWTGRRIESDIAAAKVRKDQASQEVRRRKLQIEQEVEQALVELDAARQAAQSAARAAKASKEILELATLRYEAGLATSVDTQVAQSGFAASEDLRIRTEYEILLAQARLAKARGGLLAGIVN